MKQLNFRVCIVFVFLMSHLTAMGEEPKLIAIRAGRLFDVENGKVLKDQVILIKDDRILSVGSSKKIVIPIDSKQIDLSDSTVLPGLIDAHTHFTSNPLWSGSSGYGISDTRSAVYGARAARLTLDAGFTCVRDVGAFGHADVAIRDAINDGDIVGPRMRVSTIPIGITGGPTDDTTLSPEYHYIAPGIANDPWAARTRVREAVKYGADMIKMMATGSVLGGGIPGTQMLTLEEMKAIVDEAHKFGKKVAAHAHGTNGIKDAILAGADSIEHASLIDAEGIKLAREKGTYLVMDIYVDDYILGEGAKLGLTAEQLKKEKEVGDQQRENFKRAWKAGVKMAFGTDAGIYPHGDNAKQFPYMIKYGMTEMEAVQAATIQAARLMSMESEVGSLRPGKFADIIAVQGNLEADVRLLQNVQFVMKGGEVIKGKKSY